MCTVIKVKRKITDDPVDCLLIECKKKKLLSNFSDSNKQDLIKDNETTSDSNEFDSIKQILKYAGSANNEVTFITFFFSILHSQNQLIWLK